MNPGGSVKDRAAWGLVRDAEEQGILTKGKDGIIVEGTAGNTGIGLGLVARARGYRTEIVMPKTQSEEKKDFLRLCGARLHLVEAVPYRNPKNYVRYSETLAQELRKSSNVPVLWANQFDNCANRRMHIETTAEEIWTTNVGAYRCVHLLGRHRRHAGRSRHGLEGQRPLSAYCPRRPHGLSPV